jgi:class 3 adenylate cyclase
MKRCLRCEQDCLDSARFCESCGNEFASACSGCGRALAEVANFCSFCGTPRGSACSSRPDLPLTVPEVEDERRQLTVMFCDLVDSTPLAMQLDAELLRLAIRTLHELCETVVLEFEARIAQFLGDGVLIYFGHPQAHEDDPERAVLAACRVLDAMPRLNERLCERIPQLVDRPLRVRIGIHSGPVVLASHGDAANRETIAWGDSVNIAARLQTEAQPGTALISIQTQQYVRAAFDLEALGAVSLKGIDQPVSVYRVVGPKRQPERRRAATDRGTLVGRDAELLLLADAWTAARAGAGRVVWIGGAAGIGKSALLRALRVRIPANEAAWLTLNASAYHEHSAFQPVIEFLRGTLALDPARDPKDSARRIGGVLRDLGMHEAQSQHALEMLLGIESGTAPEAPSPELRRSEILETLVAGCLRIARAHPLILAIEDAQWLDPSTLEVLDDLLERVENERVLVLLTHRPQFEPKQAKALLDSRIVLQPLAAPEMRRLIETVPGADALPASIVDGLVSRADGIPLYAEELSRAVVESGAAAGYTRAVRIEGEEAYEIPTSLQGSLMGRLDRLGPAKTVAQIASVLGRRFSIDLLGSVMAIDPARLVPHLEALESAELLAHAGTAKATYVFKQSMLQQAAYESLLHRRRREIHASAARALSGEFAEIAADAPEMVARHYRNGGCISEAIEWWQQAAQHAQRRHALQEEIAHLKHALETLVAKVPPDEERDVRELDLRIPLAEKLISTSGFVSPEAQRVLVRARELCAATESHQRLNSVLMLQALLALGRGEYAMTLSLTGEVKLMLPCEDEPGLEPQISMMRGGALGEICELEEACGELSNAIAILDSELASKVDRIQRIGVRTMSQTWLSQNLALRGRIDEALAAAAEAVDLARADDLAPQILAQALIGASWLGALLRDTTAAAAAAAELVALSRASELPFGVAHGMMIGGWADMECGRIEAGMTAMAEGLERRRQVGTSMRLSFYLAQYATVCLRAGDIDEAITTLDAAFDFVQRTGEAWYVPELHRIRGEVALVGSPAPGAAEGHFERAVDIAAASGLPLFELRAMTALSRLRGAADPRLEERCKQFSPGAKLPDVVEARELL